MEDRFLRGLTAGIIGAVVSAIYSAFAGFIGFSTLPPAKWIAIFLYAHTPPFGTGELIFGYLGQIMMGATLGVLFALWVPYVTSRNLLLKGWVFSITVWFTIYAITTLFQLMGTVPTPFKTAISNFVSATIYGLTLAVALRAVTTEDHAASYRLSMAPARKPFESEDDK